MSNAVDALEKDRRPLYVLHTAFSRGSRWMVWAVGEKAKGSAATAASPRRAGSRMPRGTWRLPTPVLAQSRKP